MSSPYAGSPDEQPKKGLSGAALILIGVVIVLVVLGVMFWTGRLFWYLGIVGIGMAVYGVIGLAGKNKPAGPGNGFPGQAPSPFDSHTDPNSMEISDQGGYVNQQPPQNPPPPGS